MENKGTNKFELSNFLQNQKRKDLLLNVLAIATIVVLSVLQAISSKLAQNGISVY